MSSNYLYLKKGKGIQDNHAHIMCVCVDYISIQVENALHQGCSHSRSAKEYVRVRMCVCVCVLHLYSNKCIVLRYQPFKIILFWIGNIFSIPSWESNLELSTCPPQPLARWILLPFFLNLNMNSCVTMSDKLIIHICSQISFTHFMATS